MTTKVNCDHCGNKFTGFNNWKNAIGELEICRKCYDALSPFSVATVYETVTEVNTAHELLLSKLKDQGYTDEQIHEADAFMLRRVRKLETGFDGNEVDRKRYVFEKDVVSGYYNEDITKHMTTTGFNFEGYNIKAYHGVVTGEMVLGTGFFTGFGAGISDLLGVRQKVTDKN